MIDIRYASIRSMDISNGEGIGVALFVQGCHFHCKNCFNPETWDFNGGKEWTSETKEKFLDLIDRPYIKRVSLLGGECLAEENLDDVLDLVTEINKRYNAPQYIDNTSGNKHNISTNNPDEIRLSLPNKTIWIYSGYKFEDCLIKDKMCEENVIRALRYEIIKQCDVLVDGRYIDSQQDITLAFRGSSNQRVIDIQKTLNTNKVVLYIE